MMEGIFNTFVSNVETQTNRIASAISGELTGPLSAAMIIYIMVYGICLMRGILNDPVMNFVVRGIKMAVIWTLIGTAGSYNSWVSNLIIKDIPEFVNSVTGGNGNYTNSFDLVLDIVVEICNDIQETYTSASLLGIGKTIYGYIMSTSLMVIGGILASIMFVLSILVHFALAILAAIGPLFICFALFEFSRGWFFSWLGTILNFALVKLLILVLVTLVVKLLGSVGTASGVLDAAGAYMTYLVAFICSIILFFIVPSIAASLSAGAQLSTGMLQRSVQRGLGVQGGGSGGGNGRQSSSGSAKRI